MKHGLHRMMVSKKGISFQTVPIPWVPSLKLTVAPKNGWLEYKPFLLGRPIFRGKMAVSFREGIIRVFNVFMP